MNGKFLWDIVRSRPKSLAVVLLLILLNGGLFFFSSYHQQPRLLELRQQWAEKRRAGGVRDAAAIFRQGTSDLATWHARIAPKKDFARLIGTLFDTAASNSLKVGGVSYKPVPVKEDNLLAFTISFGVSGKYAAVKSFIADLMHTKEIVTLDNVSLASTKLTEESVDMKVQLTAYFKAEGP